MNLENCPLDLKIQERRDMLMSPVAIERRSMEIIASELAMRQYHPEPESEPILMRVIHTTADFDYIENLTLSPGAVSGALRAIKSGTAIVTDTNMAKSGINQRALSQLGLKLYCDMADPEVLKAAQDSGQTRAVEAQRLAAQRYPGAILVIGNAPTALLEICHLLETGLRPALVVGVPVGFVNVVESKEEIIASCTAYDVPYIVVRGRKGGSNVAAAIINALLYMALNQVEPGDRL